LAANISGIDEDSDKIEMALTRTIFLALSKKKFVKFGHISPFITFAKEVVLPEFVCLSVC